MSIITRTLVAGVAMVLLRTPPVFPQAPSTPPPQAPPAVPEAPQAQTTPEAYSYDPDGRRDPFVSLQARGNDLRATSKRPDGIAGLLINEVTIRGIVRNRGSLVAMVQAPDTKTYLLHTADRLFDGVVKTINTDSVIFLQEVNDPLSLIKQREVRKALRAMEDGK
ncbi:MAG: hypothetical protein HYX76_10360 [Acidobacteria bacterium]|nr:hypothetical protein [Acidobacteriota bacterium]